VRNDARSREPDRLIRLVNVDKVFETPAGAFAALRSVNLDVGAGEFVAVVGKSGSGKSTLINMITGIDRPSGGEVWIGGMPIHSLNEGQLAAWRGRNVGEVLGYE
jgi:putative ABC transport system ATP-binding protein